MRTVSDAADRPTKMKTEKGMLNLATQKSLVTLKNSFNGV